MMPHGIFKDQWGKQENGYPHVDGLVQKSYTIGLILGLRPANERRRYKVTPSRIGWAQT